MAKKVIAAEIKLESKQAEQSVGSFKKQLREANEELITMAEKFGGTSNEAINAAKKVAQLRDAMGDAKELAESFNPDRKFNAFAGSINGVVGGFSALQGAMATFGAESQVVEKALLKVQGAMALSQGLNQILSSVDAFKNLGAVIKSSAVFQGAYNAATTAAAAIQKLFTGAVATTTVGFKALRTAIIATGIGALIVGITLLISKIKDWTSSSESAADAQARLADETERLNEAAKASKALLDDIDQLNLKRARAAGADAEKVAALELKQLQDRQKYLLQRISDEKAAGRTFTELSQQYNDVTTALQNKELDLQIANTEKRQTADKKAHDGRVDRLKKEQQLIEEGIKLEEQLRRQLIGMVGTEEERALAQAKQNLDDNLANLKKYHLDGQIAWSIYFAELRRIQQEHNVIERTNLAVEGGQKVVMTQQTQDMINHLNDASHRVQLQQSEERQRLTDFEWEERKKKLEEIGTMTESLITIVGEQTAVGKALAIAKAVMNTYQGATEVLRSESVLPEPFGTISKIANVGAIIATGFKAVKAITAVKVPGRGGGGSAPTAITPQLPVTATTQINQDQSNNQGNAAGRTFVLESDVSGNQERIRMLNRAARIN